MLARSFVFPLLCVGTLALLHAVPAVARGGGGGGKPPYVAMADAVVERAAAKDTAGLAELANRREPDPWRALDELVRRGNWEVAEAFAKAAAGEQANRRATYVAYLKTATHDADDRKHLIAIQQVIPTRDLQKILAATEPLPDRIDSVSRILWVQTHAEVLSAMKELARSHAVYRRAAEATEAMGWRSRALTLFHLGGMSSYYHADWEGTLAMWRDKLRVARDLDDKKEIAITIGNLAVVNTRSNNHKAALALYEEALELYKDAKNDLGVAQTLQNMGNLYRNLGNIGKARSYVDRALRLARKIGNEPGVAAATGTLALITKQLGDIPRAISLYEESLALQKKLQNKRGVAAMYGNLGTLYQNLGDYEKARSYQQQSLELKQELRDRVGIPTSLLSMGTIAFWEGDFGEAMKWYAEAKKAYEEIGNARGVADVLANIALVHTRRGEPAKALEVQLQVMPMREATGDRAAIVRGHLNMALTLIDLDRLDDAEEAANKAFRGAKRLRERLLVANSLSTLARIALRKGDLDKALLRAQQGLEAIERLVGGLGEDEAASARTRHAPIFEIGALAAARLEEPAEMLAFFESGRSGALLESLGDGRAVRFADLPEELLEAEQRAKAKEAKARRAYAAAIESGKLRDSAKRSKELDAALEEIRQVSARIQRESKRAAGLLFPTVATLDELEGKLEDHQALVLYGLCLEEALALIVRPDGSRIVSLGPVDAVLEACEALDASSPENDVAAALARLQALLVAPLKLEKTIRTVLISPEGALCYVPFGALFEQAVGMTPSGTTHALLLDEERGRAEGVLALGDPDYAGISPGAHALYFRGRKLSPLPATRKEVEQIGTVKLLGAKANEAQLVDALKQQKRWRAVHLACHGLIDPERPTLSSLALSGADGGDGFLTALEVLRMDMPADLAVLSACETGRGKIVKGEGIVGLTRAFMYAGAPRVLCSLWKVDDEATQALMLEFYKQWSPKTGDGLSAAAALAKAQAHVRAQKQWTHPYYWSAFVLWGLPE